VIGDGSTCALVRADGVIDWQCLPRFDSPSVFAAILDPERGGRTGITPVSRPFESLQRYDPDTNVLETLFNVPGQGQVRLTDYMPCTGDPRASIHEIHRRVECCEGAVELEACFDPRFGYGENRTRLEVGQYGVLARGTEGERLAASLDASSRWEHRSEGGVRSRFRLRSGERSWMVLSWGAPDPQPIPAYRPFEHLRRTRQFWREWSRALDYDGPWRHDVMRSALLLKLLIYGPTGGMVAAPTCSLPEWLGGTRNWDYRFVWTRDTAMAVRAGNLLGYEHEARDFFHFIRDALDRSEGLGIMYTVDGGTVPDERELPHLAGHAGSRPVRIGNGARDQSQLDTAGSLVDAAFLYERFGGSLSLRAWRHLGEVIDGVSRRWREPDHGIWEVRCTPRHNVHSKTMSWVALDRGRQLAQLFGEHVRAEQWSRVASEIREDVLKHGLDPRGEHFVATYGSRGADATLLLLPIVGFLPPDDPRIERTIRWVRSELGEGPFLHRYRREDGIAGREGAFTLCGFWLAEALAITGKLDEAQEIFVAHAESSNHLGLLAEEIDPSNGGLLGNFPQAFSHLGLINAAKRIDLGLRLRDEGSGKLPRFLPE
jgi:GH15 family glucan-1,4-alpha-glucosidase